MTDDDGGHPPPSILVSDRQDAPLDQASLIALARDTLIAEGHAQVELSLSFVTDAEIAELHERYMHEPGPTDVLTFPLDEDDVTEEGLRMLGDVVAGLNALPELAGERDQGAVEPRHAEQQDSLGLDDALEDLVLAILGVAIEHEGE